MRGGGSGTRRRNWGKHSEHLAKQRPGAERNLGDGGGRITRRIFDFNKPVIAAINGAAVGVGITMMLAIDIPLLRRPPTPRDTRRLRSGHQDRAFGDGID